MKFQWTAQNVAIHGIRVRVIPNLLGLNCAECLADAIRRTLTEIRQNSSETPSGRDAILQCLARIALYHRGEEVTSIDVATDVVKAIAISEFPQPMMGPVIDRWSRDIAELLLDDEVGRQQLIAVWSQVLR